MGRFDGGRLGGWEDRRRGRARREAGGKKDGARKKTKPYTTIPSRGFAPGKLPLDRPHQGAAMLMNECVGMPKRARKDGTEKLALEQAERESSEIKIWAYLEPEFASGS